MTGSSRASCANRLRNASSRPKITRRPEDRPARVRDAATIASRLALRCAGSGSARRIGVERAHVQRGARTPARAARGDDACARARRARARTSSRPRLVQDADQVDDRGRRRATQRARASRGSWMSRLDDLDRRQQDQVLARARGGASARRRGGRRRRAARRGGGRRSRCRPARRRAAAAPFSSVASATAVRTAAPARRAARRCRGARSAATYGVSSACA